MEDDQPRFDDIDWKIGLEGRNWKDEPGGPRARFHLAPEKIEMIHGKVFGNDNQRLMMVALLLENLGVERVVQIGDPNVWREAVARLDRE